MTRSIITHEQASKVWQQLIISLSCVLLLSAGVLPRAHAREIPSDNEIATTVARELFMDEGVASHLIDVRVSDGVALLSGSVDNILARDRAAEIAGAVRGVRGVVNDVHVNPPKRADKDIEEDIRWALTFDPATDIHEVKALVENGMVTLSGTVDSLAEKELAATVAKGIAGVKGLINDIDVSYQLERTDFEIRADVEEALKWNIHLNHDQIHASVQSGRVRLTGTVRSATEKWKAASVAWVAGVKEVDNDLLILGSAEKKDLRSIRLIQPSDGEIREAMMHAFKLNPRLASYDLAVRIEHGTATLTGEVDHLTAQQAATKAARDIVGVYRVYNHIRVRPSRIPSKDELVKVISERLSSDPYVEPHQITVVARNGKATLYGKVDSLFESLRAKSVAAQVPGVVEVDSRLEIRDQSKPIKTDSEIQEAIENELYWSPFVDSEDVLVSVQDGVATLTGTVDNWVERNSVISNARQGGATAINDQMEILNNSRETLENSDSG